jgi:mannose-1-phosphate guanylyltransferase
MKDTDLLKSHWCIVVDDHGPGGPIAAAMDRAPVQYCRLGREATPLQRALHRAAAIAPASHIMLTALEEYRDRWEPAAWLIRPCRRFVSHERSASLLSSAAAILSVAARAPSSVLTILPARCYVADEWILNRGIRYALAQLPHIPEGVATLGMMDMNDGVDENYLVVSRPRSGGGLKVDGFARRPIPWVARHLKFQGAMVASGIMIGYAEVFAAHVVKHWPAIASNLAQISQAAEVAGEECRLSASMVRAVPKSVLRALRWHPPAFAQRAVGVSRSGWSGLHSPQSVARIAEFLSREGKEEIGEPLTSLEFYAGSLAKTQESPSPA